MNVKTKTVRKKMNAGDLKDLIDLPDYADDQLCRYVEKNLKE